MSILLRVAIACREALPISRRSDRTKTECDEDVYVRYQGNCFDKQNRKIRYSLSEK
ncbi:hypothetical protein [Cylindrospermopsis raciborskii]|uniref:hypothetical protein n=1 Tax=Cylindrospermopsis raciborskii TaxID=77022 RepID=UPI0002D7DB59|nr:hypothetical protein [Cylindrospermopsis raciborskii]